MISSLSIYIVYIFIYLSKAKSEVPVNTLISYFKQKSATVQPDHRHIRTPRAAENCTPRKAVSDGLILNVQSLPNSYRLFGL